MVHYVQATNTCTEKYTEITYLDIIADDGDEYKEDIDHFVSETD